MALITEDRFNHAQRYADVRARILGRGGVNAHFLEEGEWAAAQPSALDLSTFTQLDAPVNVLALCEDWCNDSADTLPILDRIARETGRLNLRVLSRDANRDLADQFLWHGEVSKTPTVIMLDAELNPIRHVIERPESVTDARNGRRRALHAARPELGGFDAQPGDLPDDVREARERAETALHRDMAAFAVPEVVSWLSAAVAPA